MTSPTGSRFPDLAGRAVVAVGADESLVAITRALSANAMLIAVAAADRELVARCVTVAESVGATVNGFTVDPTDPAVWRRIAPHIEQRLGPIDVVVSAAGDAGHDVVVAALMPDMVARRRGVVIAVGGPEPVTALPSGVRHVGISGELSAPELAAAVLRHARDPAT